MENLSFHYRHTQNETTLNYMRVKKTVTDDWPYMYLAVYWIGGYGRCLDG